MPSARRARAGAGFASECGGGPRSLRAGDRHRTPGLRPRPGRRDRRQREAAVTGGSARPPLPAAAQTPGPPAPDPLIQHPNPGTHRPHRTAPCPNQAERHWVKAGLEPRPWFSEVRPYRGCSETLLPRRSELCPSLGIYPGLAHDREDFVHLFWNILIRPEIPRPPTLGPRAEALRYRARDRRRPARRCQRMLDRALPGLPGPPGPPGPPGHGGGGRVRPERAGAIRLGASGVPVGRAGKNPPGGPGPGRLAGAEPAPVGPGRAE